MFTAGFGGTEPPSPPLAVPRVSHRETAAIYTELKHFSDQKKGTFFDNVALA